jgi:hypothetical protein
VHGYQKAWHSREEEEREKEKEKEQELAKKEES